MVAIIGAILAGISAVGLFVWKLATGDDGQAPAPAVGVNSDPDVLDSNGIPIGAQYIVRAFPSEIGAPPAGAESSCGGRFEWASKLGAVVADHVGVRVALELGDLESLSVQGYEIVRDEKEQAAPLAGTLLTCAGTGGPLLRTLQLELRRGGEEASYVDGDGEPADFAFSVTKDKPVQFDVAAHAIDCDCRWRLRLITLENGKRRERIIDDHGRPFRTSSSAKATPVYWSTSAGRWVASESVNEPALPEPPADDRSVCPAIRDQLTAALPAGATYDGSIAGFQWSRGFSGGDDLNTASSVCSWTWGTPDKDGFTPTLAVQHHIAPSLAAATEDFEFLRQRMGNGKWTTLSSRRGTALLGDDGDVGLMLVQDEIYVVTMAPTDAAITKKALQIVIAQAGRRHN